MSPIWPFLATVPLVLTFIFIVGVFRRDFKVMLGGLPGPLLFLLWLILASLPPEPQEALSEIIKTEHLDDITEVQIHKPTFMDGHFISCQLPTNNVSIYLRDEFKASRFKHSKFLRNQELPREWPDPSGIETTTFSGIVNHQSVKIYFNPSTNFIYASLLYPQW